MYPSASRFLPLTACLVTFAAVHPCAAQVRVEVTPFVGVYFPGAHLVDMERAGDFGDDTYTLSGANVRQARALNGGGQLTAWLGNQVAIEVTGAYSPGETVTSTYACNCVVPGGCYPKPCVIDTDKSAHVVTGSARLLLAFAPPRVRRPSLYVVVGGGVVNHGGTGFHAAEQTAGTALQSTYWGPIVGVGVRLPLTPTRAPRLELVRVQPGSQGQADWVLSAGVSVSLSDNNNEAR